MKKSSGRKRSESAEEKLSKLRSDNIALKYWQNRDQGKTYTNAAETQNRRLGTMVGDGLTQLGELMTGNLRSIDEGGPSARRRAYAERQDSQVGQRISDRSRSIGRLAAQIARKKRNEGKK
jgi:hypothetical protein